MTLTASPPTLQERIPVVVSFNEALSIGQTRDEVRSALPQAALHVFDINPTDETSQRGVEGAWCDGDPRQVAGQGQRGFAISPGITYVETGLVPRLPTAVLSTGLMLCAMLALVCGAVLHTLTMGRREVKQFAYLRVPAPRVE